MPALPRPLLFISALALSAAAAFAQPAAGNAERVPGTENDPLMVVLKLDDLGTNKSGWFNTPRWERLSSFMRERQIKYSLGVITDSLEDITPAFSNWLAEVKKDGLVEFWFHGCDHDVREVDGVKLSEFAGLDYAEARQRFDTAQALAVTTLGKPFEVFGPPGGGKTAHIDNTSLHALVETPHMRGILYPSPIDKAGRELEAGGKISVLDRVWSINIEQPIFKPNLERLEQDFPAIAATRRYVVMQGHPSQWDDARWEEFVKIIDYLTSQNVRFVTPSALIDTLTSN